MEFIWWFSLFIYTSVRFDHTHQYDESYCGDEEVLDYIVTVWELLNYTSEDNTDLDIRGFNLGTAIIVSDRWVLTSSKIDLTDREMEKSVVQFGTSHLAVPTPLNSRYILSRKVLKELVLIEVNETFPFDTSYSSVKAAKLPPSIDFASQCKKPAINGWTQTIMIGKWTMSTRGFYCYHGTQRTTCLSGEKVITFPYDKCTFCFNGLYTDGLMANKGNAVLCNDDVLIGITYYATTSTYSSDATNIAEVGHYMTWIGETTGIEVAYQSVPKTTTEEEPTKHLRKTTQQNWKSISRLQSADETTNNYDDESNAALSTMNNFLIIVSLILSVYRLIAY